MTAGISTYIESSRANGIAVSAAADHDNVIDENTILGNTNGIIVSNDAAAVSGLSDFRSQPSERRFNRFVRATQGFWPGRRLATPSSASFAAIVLPWLAGLTCLSM